METKICCTCKKELPKTNKYFFTKSQKQKLSSGEIKTYYSFRSDCKKCHSKKGNKRRLKKRFTELGCCENTYKKAWTKKISEAKSINDQLSNISELSDRQKTYIRAKIKKGYVFTTVEQYYKDCDKNIRKRQLRRRKYNYNSDRRLTAKQINEMSIKVISKSRVALTMGIPTKNLPDDIYETKKIVIQLKRELGLTHSSIAERNINNKYKKQWKQKEI